MAATVDRLQFGVPSVLSLDGRPIHAPVVQIKDEFCHAAFGQGKMHAVLHHIRVEQAARKQHLVHVGLRSLKVWRIRCVIERIRQKLNDLVLLCEEQWSSELQTLQFRRVGGGRSDIREGILRGIECCV